jgi:hypothetical protein
MTTIGAWRRMVRRAVLLGGCLLLMVAAPASAHDLPNDTRLHGFVAVEGSQLQVLLRVPLGLLLNVDLPKQGPGYLALGHLDEGLARAVRAVDADVVWYADGQRLRLGDSRARISAPSDRSFASWEAARRQIHGPPLPDNASVFWNQGYLDLHLAYALPSPDAGIALDFHVAPALADRVRMDLRYRLPGGGERAFELATAQGRVALDPRWYQAAASFAVAGFEHILHGRDHLLFLLCLVLPFRRLGWDLVGVVTAFTLAHSVTLIAAAFGAAPGAAWFPPLVETLIAASILAMAIGNALSPHLRRRWIASAVFGLVHGFGFSFFLQSQLQFAGSNLLLSLLSFNVGVELGQLAALIVIFAALGAWRALQPLSDRALALIVAALAGHVAWHWMVDRGEALLAAEPPPGLAWIGAALLVLAAGLSVWTRPRADRIAQPQAGAVRTPGR